MEKVSPMLKSKSFGWMFLVILFVLTQTSCKKDKNNADYPVGSNENINTWILDSLKRYYYWNEALPSKPDLSIKPQDFFNSIRNSTDRFSYILLPADPSTVPANNRGKYGFDYTTVSTQSPSLTFGIIKLVLNDSPASRSGLKRGDYISKINGKQLTAANAAALQVELLSGSGVSLSLAEIEGNTLKDLRTVSLSPGFIFEQASLSRVFDTGGKKIGYLYVNDFNPGLATSVFNKFAAFKTDGITDLILDLRYNGGGQVAEAAGLCALIAGLSYDKPFITYKGNRNGGTRTESAGITATFDGTINFNTLLQNELGLSKVYILGTGATASASEVMINNLKPYLQVVLVGEKTRGKDEASFRIFDEHNPKIVEWEMHPIIYKLFNSAGNGGYSAGISPDINIDELSSLPLLPFGDLNDPLVQAAVSRITGVARIPASGLSAKSIKIMIGNVLTDTGVQTADNSIVITHR